MQRLTIFVSAFFVFLSLASTNVFAQTDSFLFERGWNYEIWKNPEGSFTYKTGEIPLWAYDYTQEKYVPYVFEDKGSYITVANGLIGADIRPDYSVFYDTNKTNVRVRNETWLLERYDKGWKILKLQFEGRNIFKNSTGVFPTNIYKVFEGENLRGELNITFVLREGKPLEHVLTYKGFGGTYRLRQLWEGNNFTYVKFVDGKERALSTITSLTGNEIPEDFGTKRLAFLDREGYMLVSEDLTSARDKIISMNVDSKKKSVEFVYGTWSISNGESFVLDPATFSSSSPTQHGFIKTALTFDSVCSITVSDRDTLDANMYILTATNTESNRCANVYSQWDITSITDASDVTDVVFKFDIQSTTGTKNCDYMEINNKPSTATDQTLLDDTNDGTVFVSNDVTCKTAGDNKSLDLGASADLDVEAQLTTDWWAVAVRLNPWSRDASTHQNIMNGGAAAVPKPTLEVTYTPPNTVPRFADNNTYQNTTRSATNTYTYSSSLNISASINITDPNGDAQLETVIIQVNGTNITNKGTTNSWLGSGLRIYNKSLGGQYYVNFTSLAAGTYVALWWVNDSSNGQNQSTNFTITINKAATSTQMFLNGSRADTNYKINRAANFTATANVTGVTVNIDTNITGWNVQSETDFVTNVSTLTSTGRFNITGYFTENANYTSSIETFYATVSSPEPSPSCFNSTRVNNFFICSYDDSEFSPAKTSGIFYAGRKSDFINLCNDAAYSEYVFNVTGAQAFKAIIPFASATCNTIGNQTSIIEKQGLPSRPFGSYALTGPAKLQLSLKYDRILINGTDRFGSGQHKICIQKIGRQGGNALVDVKTC